MRNRDSSSSTDTDCSSVSTLYTNSMASFSPSNCSSSSSSMVDYETRCEGLDLLVKAVVHVAGCFLVVPFTQRRVIRRRKRNLSLSFATDFIKDQEEEIQEEDEEVVEIQEKKQKQKKKGKQRKVISKPKRKKRVMALPSKYNDSVLHPWIRRTRNRQSIEEPSS